MELKIDTEKEDPAYCTVCHCLKDNNLDNVKSNIGRLAYVFDEIDMTRKGVLCDACDAGQRAEGVANTIIADLAIKKNNIKGYFDKSIFLKTIDNVKTYWRVLYTPSAANEFWKEKFSNAIDRNVNSSEFYQNIYARQTNTKTREY